MHPKAARCNITRWLCLAALTALASGCGQGATKPTAAQRAETRTTLVKFDQRRAYVYALSLSSTTSMTGASELDIALKAKLEVSSAGTEALFVALREVELSSRHAELGAFEELARELQAGFVVELRDGEAARVLMARPSLFAANLARSIAAELALGAAPATGVTRWEAASSDAAGSYVTEYRTSAGSESVQLRKLRYAPSAIGKLPGSNDDLVLTPRVVASQGEARVVQGELRRLSYSERLTTPLLGSGTASAETKISLELLGRQALSAHVRDLAKLRAGMVDVSQAAPDASPDPTALDDSKIGDFTFSSASQKLLELGRSGALILDAHASEKESVADKAAREQRLAEFNRAFTALTALLRRDPAAVDACVQAIRIDAERATFSIDALAGAGNARAQAALLALADDPGVPRQLQQRAESSLLMLDVPAAATVDALLAWSTQPKRRINAVYGLGIQARNLRVAGQPELARRAAQRLGQMLAQTQSTSERVHLLRGIANSGDSSLLTAVTPLLRSEDASVRGAALEALRLMDAPEVDGIIAHSLRNESSYQALRAAVDTARVRTPSDTLGRALGEAARNSQDSQTRYRATQVLARWVDRRSELRSVLSQIATHDQNEDIRNLAAKALAPS
jgi:hypothetical protein